MFAWESLPDGRNLHGWTENATKLWADKIKPYQALSVEELDALLRMQIPEGFTMPSTTALHMLAARLHKGEES